MKQNYILIFMLFIQPISGSRKDPKADFNDNSGNWYEKLEALKAARLIVDSIVELSQKALTHEAKIKDLANKATNAIDDFNNLDLTKWSSDESKEISDLRQELDSKHKEMQSIYEKLKQAYPNKYDTQVNNSARIKNSAMTYLSDIERTKDERKAKYLLGILENDLENLRNIDSYLDVSLVNYIQKLSSKANQLITQANEIKDKIRLIDEAAQQEKAQFKEKSKTNQLKETIQPQKNFFARMWDNIKNFFSSIF